MSFNNYRVHRGDVTVIFGRILQTLLQLLLLPMSTHLCVFLSIQVAIKQISSDRVQQWARLVSFTIIIFIIGSSFGLKHVRKQFLKSKGKS